MIRCKKCKVKTSKPGLCNQCLSEVVSLTRKTFLKAHSRRSKFDEVFYVLLIFWPALATYIFFQGLGDKGPGQQSVSTAICISSLAVLAISGIIITGAGSRNSSDEQEFEVGIEADFGLAVDVDSVIDSQPEVEVVSSTLDIFENPDRYYMVFPKLLLLSLFALVLAISSFIMGISLYVAK